MYILSSELLCFIPFAEGSRFTEQLYQLLKISIKENTDKNNLASPLCISQTRLFKAIKNRQLSFYKKGLITFVSQVWHYLLKCGVRSVGKDMWGKKWGFTLSMEIFSLVLYISHVILTDTFFLYIYTLVPRSFDTTLKLAPV